MNQGLNFFGNIRVSAIEKEVHQLVTMDALEPGDPKMLIREYLRVSMAYLMFLEEKRDGAIKARGCCDGRIQRHYTTKEETSPPTFMQERLRVTFIIDAMEGRDVDIVNIPDAFLQTDMVHGNSIVRVRLCGVLADILVNIDPLKFGDKAILEGRHKVIYADLNKALYVALIASLLFWRDLSGALGSWGFEPDLYDNCVMNKTVDGK